MVLKAFFFLIFFQKIRLSISLRANLNEMSIVIFFVYNKNKNSMEVASSQPVFHSFVHSLFPKATV